jgi:hypothetical protein
MDPKAPGNARGIQLTMDHQHFEVLLADRFSPPAQGLLSPSYYRLGSRGQLQP